MGTPSACMYATILYGLHECLNILPKFKTTIKYYKWYINDIFAIWIPPNQTDNNITWNDFKTALDEFGNLQWKVEEPTDNVTFLDLNLTIAKGRITSATYQKPINLHLYLPPLSAHPTSCIKGLIVGNILGYWKQNNAKEFISCTEDT